MAWEYYATQLPSVTITERSWDSSRTASGSSSGFTEGSVASLYSVASRWSTTRHFGASVWYGTGAALFSIITGTSTITGWEHWHIETWSSSSTFSASSSYMETIGTTRTVLTGTGGTKRESSYRTIVAVTLGTQSGVDGYFTGGTSGTFLTLQTFVSSTHISFENTAGVVVTTTFSGSNQTTQSATGTYTNNRSYIYTSSTASTSTNTTATVTTTFNRTYTFPTSTTGPATTSTSSTTLATTSTTVATTTSSASYQTASFSNYLIIQTIVELATSDWGWKSTGTTTSTGQPSEIGESFTGTSTFGQRAIGRSVTWTPVSATYTSSVGNAGSSSESTTWADVFITVVTTSSNFSIRTTVLETYTIGASTTSSNLAPLTTQATISRTVTTTTLSAFTWHNTTTTDFGTTTRPLWMSLVIFTVTGSTTLTSTRTGFDVPTYTTSTAGGTLYDTNSADTLNSTTSLTRSGSNTASTTAITQYHEDGSSMTDNPNRRVNQNFDFWSYDRQQFRISLITPQSPSYCAPAIAGGFQAWNSTGPGSDIFQNLAGGSVPVLSFGHIFPNVIVPLMDQNTATFSLGTSNATSQYVRTANEVHLTVQTGAATTDTAGSTLTISATGSIAMDRQSVHTSESTIGGYGWLRATSDKSQLTASEGIHRYTLLDSSGGTTTGFISWNAVSSTFDVANGNAIALETVPKQQIYSQQPTSYQSPVTTFSAFPSP